jgi:hypothetical protein
MRFVSILLVVLSLMAAAGAQAKGEVTAATLIRLAGSGQPGTSECAGRGAGNPCAATALAAYAIFYGRHLLSCRSPRRALTPVRAPRSS